MRYRTLLERQIDEWDDGYGVVQIVNPEGTDDAELRFAYYKNGEFVNRPLTVAPSAEVAERTAEVVGTMASIARTLTPERLRERGPGEVLDVVVAEQVRRRERRPLEAPDHGLYALPVDGGRRPVLDQVAEFDLHAEDGRGGARGR